MSEKKQSNFWPPINLFVMMLAMIVGNLLGRWMAAWK